MEDLLTREGIKYIVTRVLDNAYDVVKEIEENGKDDFLSGKQLAYYEMLDTIKNELYVRDTDLKEFGLDFLLESLMSSKRKR